MEFASFFNALGTRVTVIEMMPKILGPMDAEISDMLLKSYAKKGIEFKLGCKVTAVDGGRVLYLSPEGEECSAEGEKILVSVGRRAVLKGYGLENLGVETERGIKVDARMRTNVPGVYAAGDVTGFSMLAHTASREGEVAVNTILGKDDAMSYNAIPGIVYTNPEVAGVGLTEEEAIRRGGCTIKKLPMTYSGRFVAENEGADGLCKILINKKKRNIIGVHMIGSYSSEIIWGAAEMIEMQLRVTDARQIIFPHPTVSEILREVLWEFDD